MGLFKKSYVEKIKGISERIEQVSLSEDDLILKFTSKVKEIEELDIECIKLLKRIAKEGHISEKQKRALLSQLVFLLRRLEKLKFEEKSQMAAIKLAIEDILQTELTIERLGIEFNGFLYHGTGVIGIKSFEVDMEDFDYMGSATLGWGINCTDNKKMAVNYAFYRYNYYTGRQDLREKYGNRIQPTMYTFRLRRGRNYIADLTDPIKLRSVYNDLLGYIKKEAEEKKNNLLVQTQLHNFVSYLQLIIRKNSVFVNIRDMLTGKDFPVSVQNMIYWINKFLKELGYHGLRCMEGGEVRESIVPWEKSMTYLIFDPNDIEIIKEEHFKIINGKLVKTK